MPRTVEDPVPPVNKGGPAMKFIDPRIAELRPEKQEPQIVVRNTRSF